MNQNLIETQEETNSFSLIEIWEKFRQNWYWFVLGLLLAWAGAFIYLRYAQNTYRSEAKILIKEDPSKISSELSVLTGKGMGRDATPNIADQIEVMKSRRIISKVVDNLQLNIRYFSGGRVKTQEILSEASPLQIKILSAEPNYVNFEIMIKSESEFEILYNDQTRSGKFGVINKLNNTEFIVLPKNIGKRSIDKTLQVTILPHHGATNMYKGKLQISPLGDGTSVVTVSMVDNLPQRAPVVVNELINQYVEDAINDKRIIGEKTTKFIEERLAKVSEDLQGKDRDIESFKKANQVINLEAEGSISLNEASANNSQALAQSTQLSLINFMEDYLQNNRNDLIPENIGLSDGAVNANATKYNELILTRTDMLKHSTESSQLVQNLDEQINDLRTNLQQSLDNYKKTTQISLNRMQGEGGRIASEIHQFPTQEKEFINLSRQQQIVEALYLFLLQKREENEITNAATPSPIKVVDYAYSNNSPISPNRESVYLMATAAGLLIPFGILYLSFLFNNKVQTRRDIENLGPSIIGDIPSAGSDEIIVENDRSILAESFRMLRTNIGFYLSNKKTGSRNIFITSTVSGEGKTFVASNLALIMSAAKKYRVLLVGADIRSPRLLEMLDKQQYTKHIGITQYLSDTSINIEDIIISDNRLDFDIVHSGALAPNPSELLMNGRFTELMEAVRDKYDYVIVDTAPTSLVTDTQIIAAHADLFLYIIRANYLDKRMLEMPKELYREKRLPNITFILNDISANSGYGYGYGYGYGGYATKNPKAWKRLLPKNLRKN